MYKGEAFALPMTYAGLTAVTIFVPIFSWNKLLFALILTGGENRTFTVMVPSLIGYLKGFWPQIAAAFVVQSAPVLIFILFIQRQLALGLSVGAVKR